ncbi:MAG: hypothetical protein ABWY00_16055 [Dongiaceae bacterium]
MQMHSDRDWARAVLDTALADWEASKRFLGDVLTGQRRERTGAVPLKSPGDTLQSAIYNEWRAEIAWTLALKRLREAGDVTGQTFTAKEDHWLQLRDAIGIRSQLVVELSDYQLHGTVVPPRLRRAYEKACRVERLLALGSGQDAS